MGDNEATVGSLPETGLGCLWSRWKCDFSRIVTTNQTES